MIKKSDFLLKIFVMIIIIAVSPLSGFVIANAQTQGGEFSNKLQGNSNTKPEDALLKKNTETPTNVPSENSNDAIDLGVADSCLQEFTGFSLGSVLGKMQTAIQGFISSLLPIPLVDSPIPAPFPVPVSDAGTHARLDVQTSIAAQNSLKQNCLDKIATAIAKKILRDLTNSIVQWANSGFDGNPAFIQNPGKFFKQSADEIAGQFIEGTDLDFLCDPFKFNIRINIAQQSTFRDQVNCTLSGAIKNAENFGSFTSGNFSQGGWNGWYSMTQNIQNNPYGAELAVQTELTGRQNKVQALLNQQLSWGSGFFSYKDKKGNIITPGKTIENAIGQTIGSDMRQLEIANQFDQILRAITGALMKKALGGLGI